MNDEEQKKLFLALENKLQELEVEGIALADTEDVETFEKRAKKYHATWMVWNELRNKFNPHNIWP